MDKLAVISHLIVKLPKIVPELKKVVHEGLELKHVYDKANEDQKIDLKEATQLLDQALKLIHEINQLVKELEE